MEDCFKLLHFHLGSQITNIRSIKNALTEAARIFGNYPELDYLHAVRAGTMPPPASTRPEAAVYTRVATYLSKELEANAAAHPNPGELSAARRLTRTDSHPQARRIITVERLNPIVHQRRSRHRIDRHCRDTHRRDDHTLVVWAWHTRHFERL